VDELKTASPSGSSYILLYMSHYSTLSHFTVSVLVTKSHTRVITINTRVLMSPYESCKSLLSLQDSDDPSVQPLPNKELVV
jgi:hypothetical protein